MDSSQTTAKALGLCSGGLDSILAGLVLQRAGVAVAWVSFETPFFSADKARRASENTGIPLIVKDITPRYMEMLKNPKCGYGQHMNPCVDCHSLMFRIAGEMMPEGGFDFLFSGEVLGQRPMSQTKPSLRYVEKHSGFDGYILRPLSAKRLPETIPERKGWVRREDLLDLSGRGRKAQIRLAEEFGVKEYPNPAGGCLLTDKNYSVRLKDLFDHSETQAENELHLLQHGRHFRLSPRAKAVVGRDQRDNEALLRLYDPKRDVLINAPSVPGPMVIVPGGASPVEIQQAAAVCVGYSKSPKGEPVEVTITTPRGRETTAVMGLPPQESRAFMI